MKPIRIMTFDPRKNGRVLVGDYQDGVLTRRVTSNHFMKKEQGYGIQEDAVERLKELGCTSVHYITSSREFDIPFIEYLNAKSKDYGNGLQRFAKAPQTHPDIDGIRTLPL